MAKTVFETEVCGRCGGSGQYSFNQIDGSRCYGCGGTGHKFTKRGAAARAFYMARRTIKARDVKIGDCITIEGLVSKLTVVSISAESYAARIVNGVREPIDCRTFTGRKGKPYGTDADADVIRLLPAAENDALIAEALAYQATLTKAGTVRKGPAKPEPEEQLDVIE